MLRRAAAIPLLSAVSFNLTTATRAADPPRPARRTRPSDQAWPSAASWEQLNRQVGGQLIKVQTPLAACTDAADSTACQVILKNLKNPYFIGDQPGLTQTSGWADAWMSVPSAYAVVARGTAHVVAAVNFARANNLRQPRGRYLGPRPRRRWVPTSRRRPSRRSASGPADPR